MFLITSRKSFSAAARRLSNAFTFDTAVNMVVGGLRRSGQGELAENLKAAFPVERLSERMSFPMAGDLLSRALSGVGGNVTTSRLKNTPAFSLAPTKEASAQIMSHLDQLKAAAFTLANQKSFFNNTLGCIEAEAASFNVKPTAIMPQIHVKNSAYDLLGFVLHTFRKSKLRTVETQGLDGYTLDQFGIMKFDRTFEFTFEKDISITFQFSWKESEYETDEVSVSMDVNGFSSDDYLSGTERDGRWSCDVITAFLEQIYPSDFVQNEQVLNFVNVESENSVELLEVIDYLGGIAKR